METTVGVLRSDRNKPISQHTRGNLRFCGTKFLQHGLFRGWWIGIFEAFHFINSRNESVSKIQPSFKKKQIIAFLLLNKCVHFKPGDLIHSQRSGVPIEVWLVWSTQCLYSQRFQVDICGSKKAETSWLTTYQVICMKNIRISII